MGMDVYGRNPSDESGKYFRASIWSWRPIHTLCETVMHTEYHSWGFNDGDGYKSQAECDALADALEKYLDQFPNEAISLESNMRVDESGRFLDRGATEGHSPYKTNPEHVREFITFLRSCGGFQIC